MKPRTALPFTAETVVWQIYTVGAWSFTPRQQHPVTSGRGGPVQDARSVESEVKVAGRGVGERRGRWWGWVGRELSS